VVLWDLPAHPNRYAARLVTSGQAAWPYLLLADTLAGIQAMLPPGLVRPERMPVDPPEVVEIGSSDLRSLRNQTVGAIAVLHRAIAVRPQFFEDGQQLVARDRIVNEAATVMRHEVGNQPDQSVVVDPRYCVSLHLEFSLTQTDCSYQPGGAADARVGAWQTPLLPAQRRYRTHWHP
jgi:hypothetical protein